MKVVLREKSTHATELWATLIVFMEHVIWKNVWQKMVIVFDKYFLQNEEVSPSL